MLKPKAEASEEADKLVEKARGRYRKGKAAALAEIRDQVAALSVDIASNLSGEA